MSGFPDESFSHQDCAAGLERLLLCATDVSLAGKQWCCQTGSIWLTWIDVGLSELKHENTRQTVPPFPMMDLHYWFLLILFPCWTKSQPWNHGLCLYNWNFPSLMNEPCLHKLYHLTDRGGLWRVKIKRPAVDFTGSKRLPYPPQKKSFGFM